MKRVTKIALAVLIPTSLVGGYLSAGFYVLPYWLKEHLPELIKNETGLQASLNSASFNPLSFKLTVQGFEISKLSRFEKLDLQLNLHESIATKTLVIDHIIFETPVFNLEKNQDGTLNITSLFSNSKPEQTETQIFPLRIKSFTVSQGQFSFQDGKISEQISPLNLTITNFGTVETTPAKFNLTTLWQNVGDVTLNGEFLFSTLVTKGTASFKQVSLPNLLKLIPQTQIELTGNGELFLNFQFEMKEDLPKFEITNGALSLTDLTYQKQLKLQKLALENFSFDNTSNQLQLKNIAVNALEFSMNSKRLMLPTLTLNELSFNLQNQNLTFNSLVFNALCFNQGAAQLDLPNLTVSNASFSLSKKQFETAQISLQNAQLFDTSHNTLLFKLPEFALKKLALDLNKKTFFVDAIQAKNADVKVWLNPNGELNYQTLLPEDESRVESEKAQGNETSEAFWGIKVANVELEDFSATFEDKTLSIPATININPLTLKLTELSNEAGAKLPFELRTGINDSGALHLKGRAGLNPLMAQTEVNVKSLGLEKFQSYIDKFAHLDLIKGVFNLDGKLDIAKGQQGELDIKFKGNTGIARLITRDQKQNKDLLKWDNLTLKNVEADVLAQRYSASALLIEKPYARVVIDKNKTLNFADILIDSKPEPSTRKNKKDASPDISFTLDKLKISNGSSSFADLSLILPFSAEIRGLEGGAAGISSKHEATINLNLKGNAYDLAPVDIQGKIQPFVGDYQAALHFKGMPLPLMSSYMAEFAGYKFEKGKLSLGMNYEVINGELNATNNLKMEQIELGEKIENPHAIDAPIDLAITLLKDMDGTINLDLPITGSLNDPQFSFSGIVTDALLNVISKTITSPFQAIASLLGTDEDLSAVQFSAGSAELNEWQKPKVDNLAKVLRERALLKIEIRGTAFESQDWEFLRDEVLIERLKALRAEELNRQNKQKILPEYVELNDDDAQRLLAQEFRARFPHLVKKSFLGNLELVKPEMGEFYDVAKKQLLAEIPVEYKRLNKLAAARAKVLAKYLVEKGVPDERIFILSPAVDPPRTDNDIDALLFLKTE